ncbi:M55 family metallopeptidase [Streptomyces sp. H39-C1]|uniref:M55 family metallopeptidase n=1 Tax=Streptomyces sp. H39-C1 TaxID=3004355 RepID=UPI002F35ACCB
MRPNSPSAPSAVFSLPPDQADPVSACPPHRGRPQVLITGDLTTAEEIEPFCPGIRAAVVKTSVSRFAADGMHPAQAREVIRDAAHEAVQDLAHAAPPTIELPATLTVRFRNADLAEMATWINGAVREDALTVCLTDADPIRLYRGFVAVFMLTRAIAE